MAVLKYKDPVTGDWVKASNTVAIQSGPGGGENLDAEMATQDNLLQQIDGILAEKRAGGAMNDEIAEQDTLIAQITTALASKAANKKRTVTLRTHNATSACYMSENGEMSIVAAMMEPFEALGGFVWVWGTTSASGEYVTIANNATVYMPDGSTRTGKVLCFLEDGGWIGYDVGGSN